MIDQMVVLDTDAARARETARGPLRFLSGVGGYVANFARMGFTDADISDLSDRLVDELVVWGDADTITARMNEHLRAGADHVMLGVLNDADQPRPIEVARQLADSLVPDRPLTDLNRRTFLRGRPSESLLIRLGLGFEPFSLTRFSRTVRRGKARAG